MDLSGVSPQGLIEGAQALQQAQIAREIDVAVMKQELNAMKAQGEAVIELIEAANLGNAIDVQA